MEQVPAVLLSPLPSTLNKQMSMRWIIPKSAGNGKEKCSTTQRQYSFYSTRLSEYRVIRSFDVIISNPPYIGTEEEVDIENSVKDFEPMMALFAPQNDVLAFIVRLLMTQIISLQMEVIFFWKLIRN